MQPKTLKVTITYEGKHALFEFENSGISCYEAQAIIQQLTCKHEPPHTKLVKVCHIMKDGDEATHFGHKHDMLDYISK